jgi:hypothetical protein
MKELIPFDWTDEALDDRVTRGIEIEFCAATIKQEFQEYRDIDIKLPTVTFDEKSGD